MEPFLLVEPEVKSLAPNLFLFFRPKRLLLGEAFSLRLRVTNQGSSHFPGGKLTNIRLKHKLEGIHDPIEDKVIPSLAKDASELIELGIWHPFGVGFMALECNANLNSGEAIKCYQRLKASRKLELMQPAGRWVDFISVTHKSEIHQRYTNNILITLTIITILYYVATIFVRFPI